MARALASVALGFIVMVIFIIATFGLAGAALGDERIYRPGSFEPSALWNALSITLTFIGAILGGFAAVSIARSGNPPRFLALVVIVLGIFSAVPSMTYDRTQMPARTGAPSDREAARQVPPPLWIALLNPALGAAGVMIGARLREPEPA